MFSNHHSHGNNQLMFPKAYYTEELKHNSLPQVYKVMKGYWCNFIGGFTFETNKGESSGSKSGSSVLTVLMEE